MLVIIVGAVKFK